MRNFASTSLLALCCAGAASAGGVERSTQSIGFMFEEGRYAELTYSYFGPSVSGTSSFLGPTLTSGSMLGSFTNLTLSYKQPLTDRLDLAIVFDQPIGADVDYPAGAYPVAGTFASLDSNAITAYLRYKISSSISLIGGLRAVQTSGDVAIPFPALSPIPYTLSTSTETDLGYVVGIAWEKPEIAARVALTYNSSVTHNLDGTETSPLTGGLPVTRGFETEIPQSINLEFQTGIAADTLVFGSIRWVDWTSFNIFPAEYRALYGNPLVDYKSDRTSYTLGVGRKFTDTWSGAVLLGYEDSAGNLTGNLGPTDGYTSAGVALTYTAGDAKITGGLRYFDIGDATTTGINGNFTGNHGWGAGVRVGFNF